MSMETFYLPFATRTRRHGHGDTDTIQDQAHEDMNRDKLVNSCGRKEPIVLNQVNIYMEKTEGRNHWEEQEAANRGKIMMPCTCAGLHEESASRSEERMAMSTKLDICAKRKLPKRIIVMRHGESQGNLDMSAYTTTPDYRIPLTPHGAEQARNAGRHIRRVLSSGCEQDNWKVYFYVSPYERTRSTLREIGRAFERKRIIGVREECRIREQDFGNFQVEERMKAVKQTRERFGRFFFRFPEGESAADVFDRVASFMESLWRDIDMKRLEQDDHSETNLVIVSHGLTSRVFLMKWFKWTVDQFEMLNNLGNCEFRVMQLGPEGEYSLAIHHTKEELEQWGLTPEMIVDQQWRASADRGSWNEVCPFYLNSFFDGFKDSSEEDGDVDVDGEL